MPEITINNVKITYNERTIGWISEVLIDQINVRNTIIQLSKSITFRFDSMRPDYAKVIVSEECNDMFQTVFSVIDELYRSDKSCLAAYLSAFIFDSFTPLWNNLLNQGKHILAIQLWHEIVSWAKAWEESTGRHIHKGSPYAFIAYTFLMIGDVDTGFTYIYNAIEEDIKLNSVCPKLNYPSDAPVYLTATLSSKPANIMIPLVQEKRDMLENYLYMYRIEFQSNLSISDLDILFLQNPKLETINYYFVYTFWMIYEHQRKISQNMMLNDFSKLKYSNWFFALCLVVDNLFHSHPIYTGDFIGSEIINYVVSKGWMRRDELNNLIKRENIRGGDPDTVTQRLLASALVHNGMPVETKIQYLLIAWNIRNFAGHNIQPQDVFVSHFEDLLKILLFDIFLIVEEYR